MVTPQTVGMVPRTMAMSVDTTELSQVVLIGFCHQNLYLAIK